MSSTSEAMSEAQPLPVHTSSPFKVVEILTEAMAPVEAFERMKAVPGEDGTLKPGYEAAPLRTVDPIERMKENRMEPITYTGDKGYKLGDVLDKKVTMEEFVAQLSMKI